MGIGGVEPSLIASLHQGSTHVLPRGRIHCARKHRSFSGAATWVDAHSNTRLEACP